MKSLLAVLLFASAAAAQETKVDPAYGVRYTEERVVVLPKDADKCYLSVLGTPGDARYAEIQGWFKSGNLKAIKDQTHFNAIGTDTVMFKDRYAKSTGTTPCVRLQLADGRVAYQVSGNNIPMSAESLYIALNGECQRRWRCRPKPDPEPAPTPDIDPEPQPLEPQPDVQPDVEPASGLPPTWLIVVLAVAGVVAGVANKCKQIYYSE